MENSASSNQITDSTSFLSNSGFNSPTSNNTSSGLINFFKSITWTTWFIIFIILSLLGINIFTYLSEGTHYTANLLDRITKWFSGTVGTPIKDTTKQTINVSATGTKAGINMAATTATKAINVATKPFQTDSTSPGVAANAAYTSQLPQTLQTQSSINPESNDALYTTLQKPLSNITDVQADTSTSNIQRNKSANKSGWCFIGEEEGIRSCIEVGRNDICMSGDIFPTNDVCVNPNLRV
jgi:hypothetical protein